MLPLWNDRTRLYKLPSRIPPLTIVLSLPDSRSLSEPSSFKLLSRSLTIMRFSAVLVVLSTAFATASAAHLEQRQSGYASSSRIVSLV